MCGIFGFYLSDDHRLSVSTIQQIVKSFFLLSETRGRDASGIAIGTNEEIVSLKKYITASKLIKTDDYKSLFTTSDKFYNTSVRCLGHTRLATNGATFLEANNQPVITRDLIGIHNGIITNDEVLWGKHSQLVREHEVDTELMLKLFFFHAKKIKSMESGIIKSFSEFEGNVSCSIISPHFTPMILATNNGSLYYNISSSGFYFASERLILELFLKKFNWKTNEIIQLKPKEIITVDCQSSSLSVSKQSFFSKQTSPTFNISSDKARVIDLTNRLLEKRDNLKRCKRCILPETFPFIHFDKDGVCNYCHNYQKVEVKSQGDAIRQIEHLKKNKKSINADCLFMLSGGRDSCYALHHAVKKLGLRPIAYTYDWGMVTDIARRNAERMCGQLGIEHIIVSADIRKKRENIRKNIIAWLKKPELGMVPLFMAGDKQFLYYGKKIRDINRLPFTIISACPFEKTSFKTGFTGVDEGKNSVYNIPLMSKLKIFSYYSRQYCANPSYINSTLFDNFHAFWSAYLIKHDFFQTYEYEYWNEEKIVNTLVDKYNWELDPEAGTSWRIGDGTAAFYNYIYYTMTGFTENDTFRSNQIREGVLKREQALELVQRENRPRWKSLQWYASVVGFNLTEAIQIINQSVNIFDRIN